MPAGVSAYVPLANLTLSSSAASVTFSSINTSLYRDLVLVVNGSWASVNSSAQMRFEFNSDTTSTNYYRVSMYGDGSTAYSASSNGNSFPGSSWGYGNPAPLWNVVANFLDFSATDKHKSYLVRTDDAANQVSANALRWANTAAITSIAVKAGLSFASGTTFALYGVSA
jgi:hypothetical protein